MTSEKDLKHKTLAMVAAGEIRDRILAGEFAPGVPLRQMVLADELNMSRIPIREALLLLETEGMVKIMPHRGAVVVDLSPEEVDELFNMRLLMEPFLYARSAPRLTRDDIDTLGGNLERYKHSISEMEVSKWNSINTEFHMLLYKHSKSPRILGLVKGLLHESDRHTRIHLTSVNRGRERAIAEHTQLLTLTAEGRFNEAGALLHDHIDHIRAVLLSLLGHRQ
ncbi:GntR family transcriptional regulator [Phyllobacterium sp. SB3]|uniref:GntR family transcriptional regulator n=1 Tax=Phyllobacterium sp. SB3 TaxID=3156073 RepID=UPI0032AEFFC7